MKQTYLHSYKFVLLALSFPAALPSLADVPVAVAAAVELSFVRLCVL